MRSGVIYLVILSGSLLLAMTGCNKDKRTELFEVPHLVDFEVPAGLNTVETHFFIIPMVNSIVDDQLAATSLTIDDINTIEPKFCRLSTVFEDRDLDFLRLVEIRVVDPFDPDHSREVFYLDPVPANSKAVIRPFPGLSDVKDILSLPSFAIEVRMRFRAPPQTTLDMRLALDFGAFE